MGGPERTAEIMKTNYCLGFLFSFSGGPPVVVLVNKNRPAWMAGKLNGVGGRIEAGELPSVAMRREFNRSTGVDIAEWNPFAIVVVPDSKAQEGCEIFCFVAANDDEIFDIRSMTDEKVGIYETTDLSDALRNLNWLVPMAITRIGDWPSSEILRIEPI